MHPFRTIYTASKRNFSISHVHQIASIGSCFAESMSSQLYKHGFICNSSPFGTVFHPVALSRHIRWGISGKAHIHPDLFASNDDVVQHHYVHSKLGGYSKEEVTRTIHLHTHQWHTSIHSSDVLIITLGTAWGYMHKNTNEWIANNHKMPASLFEKKLSTVQEIEAEFDSLFSELTHVKHIILTVSPVRHTREGLEQNSISKATLRLACASLANKHEKVEYFPSYEIMMDDLRDYRFYDQDMVHPTPVAEQYIWNIFTQTYFTEETIRLSTAAHKLITSSEHKPFFKDSKAHISFVEETIRQMRELEGVHLTKYIEALSKQLHHEQRS